jgi:hypothetical protein
MKAQPQKALVSLVSALLLFALPTARSGTASAKAKTAQTDPARQTITDFLSSVDLAGPAYTFDHDQDGTVDMTVYPLMTSSPDLVTQYSTLKEALSSKRVVLKEKLTAKTPTRTDPLSSYSIVAMAMGVSRTVSSGGRSSYSFGSGYRSGYGSSSGIGFGSSGYGFRSGTRIGGGGSGYGNPSYYQGGSMLGGGYQNRGMMRGGTMGGYPGMGGGSSYYRGGSGIGRGIRYSPYGKDHRPSVSRDAPMIAAAIAGYGSRPRQQPATPSVAEPQQHAEIELDAFCFEKWRLIPQSRLRGDPEFFSYAGLASPHVRKQLVSVTNQTRAHSAIERELRRLGVSSETKAFIDVFKDPEIKHVVDYYTAASKEILSADKDISGLLITSPGAILCADVYSSPMLFKKMLGDLMQSAALGVYRSRDEAEKPVEAEHVQQFVDGLKNVKKLRNQAGQTYRLFYPKAVSAAELYTDQNGTRVVHVEAYPR